ncbi:divergent polysaccharide deacetylase family protein [Aliiroseovarius sp. KMU-50]|uniref:Divergent polysaccharide deacetylase family protein n=1 Tax=Aliiroseovarius salicola TaxID=3009082 RepID=A0ABT4W1A2_9RHOB|nr:polysaccharide deacteylase family 2 protein [Aliiroseovarius sp. KMU-50]MDA5094286.1 divergent polysaccharide deacetylase family protein [Aliiroseovarius sp. KMU-50]
MSRGFLSGAAVGAVVSGLGLAILSITTEPPENISGQLEVMPASATETQPLPTPPETASPEDSIVAPADAETDPDPVEDIATVEAPDGEATDAETAEAETGVEPDPAPSMVDPNADPAPLVAPDTADTAPSLPAAEIQNDAGSSEAAPVAPEMTVLDPAPIELPAGPAASVEESSPETMPPVSDQLAQLPQIESIPDLPTPTDQPANGAAMPEVPIASLDAPDPLPEVEQDEVSPPSPDVSVDEGSKGASEVEADPNPTERSGIKSDPVAPIGDLAPNVTTDRLPSIGSDEGEEQGDTQTAEISTEVTSQSPLAIIRNSVPFTPVEDLPTLAILLKDEGGAQTALGDLSALPFPVTFVVEANAPDAAEAIARYRAAGAEVVVEAGLPANSTPVDAEVNFQVQSDIMNMGSAVLMAIDSGFQENSDLAKQIAAILVASGHGLISHPKGLSTGHRLALKAGVPAGVIFRDVDGAGQNARAIGRFMDNAAFKSRQSGGGVIVYARARPETLQALIAWSLGNRAATVTLAPASAVLLGD